MGKFQSLTKEEVLNAVRNSGGIVLAVARKLGIKDWYTARKYINKWKETKEAFNATNEENLDRAESVVIQKIANGDVGSAKWYLTKKGKDRGYADDLAALLDEEPLKIEFTGNVTKESLAADPNVEIYDGSEEEESKGSPDSE